MSSLILTQLTFAYRIKSTRKFFYQNGIIFKLDISILPTLPLTEADNIANTLFLIFTQNLLIDAPMGDPLLMATLALMDSELESSSPPPLIMLLAYTKTCSLCCTSSIVWRNALDATYLVLFVWLVIDVDKSTDFLVPCGQSLPIYVVHVVVPGGQYLHMCGLYSGSWLPIPIHMWFMW